MSTRYTLLRTLLLAILLLPAAICISNQEAGGTELRVFYANDTGGELEPCG